MGTAPSVVTRPTPPLTKRCRTCGREKCRTEFSRANAAKDGLQGDCKACAVVRNAAWREANRDAVRSSNLVSWHRLSNERQMLAAARSRARKAGLPFDLTLEDIDIPVSCPVLGIPLGKSGGKAHRGSPSLDRIRPDRGYVRGNVRVISHRANTLKSNGTEEELRAVLEYVRAPISANSSEYVD